MADFLQPPDDAIMPAAVLRTDVRADAIQVGPSPFEPMLPECVLGNQNAAPIHARPWATLFDYICKGGIRIGGCVGLFGILLALVTAGFVVPRRIVNGQEMTFLYSLMEKFAETLAGGILFGTFGLIFGSILGGIFYIIDRYSQGSAEVGPDPHLAYERIYASVLVAVAAYVSLETIPLPDKATFYTTSAPGAPTTWLIEQNGSGLTTFEAILGACLTFLLVYGSMWTIQRIMKLKITNQPPAGAIQ